MISARSRAGGAARTHAVVHEPGRRGRRRGSTAGSAASAASGATRSPRRASTTKRRTRPPRRVEDPGRLRSRQRTTPESSAHHSGVVGTLLRSRRRWRSAFDGEIGRGGRMRRAGAAAAGRRGGGGGGWCRRRCASRGAGRRRRGGRGPCRASGRRTRARTTSPESSLTEPSRASASRSAPRPSARYSTIEPSPVERFQSRAIFDPAAARTTTLPSSVLTRSPSSRPCTAMLPSSEATSHLPSTPSSRMAPSSVCATTSPARSRPVTLPSAGPQLHLAVDVVDADAAVAGADDQVAAGGDGDDQLRRARDAVPADAGRTSRRPGPSCAPRRGRRRPSARRGPRWPRPRPCPGRASRLRPRSRRGPSRG